MRTHRLSPKRERSFVLRLWSYEIKVLNPELRFLITIPEESGGVTRGPEDGWEGTVTEESYLKESDCNPERKLVSPSTHNPFSHFHPIFYQGLVTDCFQIRRIVIRYEFLIVT